MSRIYGFFVLALAGMSIVLAEDQSESSVLAPQAQIAAQPVADALTALAQQSGLQIIYGADIVRGRVSNGAPAGLPPKEALARVLEGTGLSFEFLNERTVTITSLAERKPAAHRGIDSSDFRMAAGSSESDTSSFRQAQDTDQSSSDRDESSRQAKVEEVVVTAQRREERLQDVPISISVLSGEKLDRSTFQGVQEALSTMPGVTVDMGGGTGPVGGGTQVAVRGVTAPTSYNVGSSPVGYYLDTVPFAFVRHSTVPDANVYDLERVEALRGPQGTLYGANSQGGVVRVLTKNPDLERFELKSRVGFSHTETGGEGGRVDAALNIPLIAGKLAMRAVGGYQDLSGWIDKPARADANDSEHYNARLKVKAQPTEQLSMDLFAWLSRIDRGAFDVADASGLRVGTADVERLSADFNAYGLTVAYEFPALTVTSMSSYLDYEGVTDFGAVGNLPISHFVQPSETFAQEINIASARGDTWRWTAGSIYRDSKDEHFQTLPFISGWQPQLLSHLSESWAVFGELTRIFFDGRLELTAGLRYFEDQVGIRERLRAGFAQPPAYINRDTDFSATTPRVILTWKPQDQTMIYASYAEGFRSGFEQLPSVLVGVPFLPAVEPDLLKNYELGAKGNLLNGRITYEAAAYYMDWQDVQLPLVVIIDEVGRSAAVNGASASGMGVDAALTTSPIEGLELGVNFSSNDLTVDRDVFSGGIVLFDKGDRLPLSIETTVGAQASYTFPLGGSGLEGRFSASANWTSEKPNKSLSGTTVVVQRGDPIALARASFSIDSTDRWSASLFVDNVNNERDATFRTVDVAGVISAFYPRPRTIGVQFEYRM